MASDLMVDIHIAAKDLFSGPAASIGRNFAKLGNEADDLARRADHTSSAFDRLGNGFQTGFGFAAGFAGLRLVGAGMEGLGDSVIGLNAKLELNKIAFTTMLGSAEAAEEMLDKLKKMAAETPFELKDLTMGTQKLLAFGFTAEQIIPTLKAIGDAAAGLGLSGAEGIDRLGRAIGQMQAKGKVSAEEMMQLAEAGVPAWDILAKGIGKTTAETMALSEKGLIPANLAIDILTQGMAARFPNAMEKASKSMTGMMSTLHDEVTLRLAGMGKPIFDALEGALSSFLGWLKQPSTTAWLDDFGVQVGNTIDNAIDLFNDMKGPVGDAFNAIGESAEFVGGKLGEFWDWLTRLNDEMAKLGVYEDLKAAWDDLRVAGGLLWGLVADTFTPAQRDMNGVLAGTDGSTEDSARSAATEIKGLSDGLRNLAQGMKDVFGPIKAAEEALNAIDAAVTANALAFNRFLSEQLNPLLDTLEEIDNWINSHLLQITVGLDTSGIPQWALDFVSGKAGAGANASGGGGGGGFRGGSDVTGASAFAAAERPSQFSDPKLTAAEALAACGPAALVAFMKAHGGRVPTLSEAVQAASNPDIGWTQQAGMAGPASEQKLFAAYGLSSDLNLTPSTSQIQQSADAGSILSTYKPGSGHYFTLGGYNAETRKYDVGTSGTDLIGGSAQMTLKEMTDLMGPVNGLITNIREAAKPTGAGLHDLDVGRGSAGAMSATEAIVRTAALKVNMDPDIAVRVWKGEGSVTGAGAGDQGSSFGPFQLHMGGLAGGGNAVAGAGDDFFAQTGLDPRDPANEAAATEWYLARVTAKGDWGESHAARAAGVGRTQGIGTGPGAGAPGEAGYVPGSPEAAAQLKALQDAASVDKEAAAQAKAIADAQRRFGNLIESAIRDLDKINLKESKDLAANVAQRGEGGTDYLRAQADADSKKAAIDEQRSLQVKDAARELIYKRGIEDQQALHAREREDAAIIVNQQLQDAAILHSRVLQDAEIVHQNELSKEAQAHSIKLQDAALLVSQELANKELLHQRTLQDAAAETQARLQAAATVHQRELQDRQVGENRGLSQEATKHSRELEDREIAYQLNRSLGKDPGNTDAIKKQAQEASEQLSHRRQLQDEEAKYQERLAAEAMVRQRKQQDEEAVYQRGLAQIAMADQRTLQDTEIVYQNTEKAKQLADQRALAVTESEYQMGLKAAELVYQRGLQDEEAKYQRTLAADALQRQRADQDAERVYAREQEDLAIQHQTELGIILAQRQKDKIDEELEVRKKAIAEEFVAREKAIIEAANAERLANKITFDARVADQIEADTEALKKYGPVGTEVTEQFKRDAASMDVMFANATRSITANEKEIVTQGAAMGTAIVGSAQDISTALGITDEDVETYADRWGLKWDAARDVMNALATAVDSVGTSVNNLPTEKTITITTHYEQTGASNSLGSSPAGSYGAFGLPMPNSGAGSAGSTGSGTGSIAGVGQPRNPQPAAMGNVSPFPASTIGTSGPGGKYNDPSTGRPYTRAAGGPVVAGGMYLVGEHEPEYFTPGGSGFITPRSAAGGTSGGLTEAQLDRLAEKVASALAGVSLSVDVNEIHTKLLRKADRVGQMGLA